MAKQVRETGVEFTTIHGLLIPETQEDYLRLNLLCHRFKEAVNKAIRLQLDDVKKLEGVKELRKILNNWWYAVSAWDFAKMLIEGCEINESNPRYIHVKSKFLISYAKSNEQGNRNVKIDYETVRIRDPFFGRMVKVQTQLWRKIYHN